MKREVFTADNLYTAPKGAHTAVITGNGLTDDRTAIAAASSSLKKVNIDIELRKSNGKHFIPMAVPKP